VVDDTSKDGTAETLATFGDARMRVVRNESPAASTWHAETA
jgi:hypothetical protein